MATINRLSVPAAVHWINACLLSTAAACSQGSEPLSDWSGGPASLHSDTTQADHDSQSWTTPESSTPGASEEGEPGDGETDEESPKEKETTFKEKSSDASSSSQLTSSSSESSNGSSGTGKHCDPELCFEFNPENKTGTSVWTHRQYILPFKLDRKLTRVARVELVEGQYDGTTTLKLRSSKSAGNGSVLAQTTWVGDSSIPSGWRGTDFDDPVEVVGGKWLWVHVFRDGKSLASTGKHGKSVPVWHRDSDSDKWSKEFVAVKIRVYCCKEESR